MKGFIKKSGIYLDTEVKEGSNNAVTSGAVAKAIEEGGGGGGGSTDYADLTNKPKINNVELSGNKSLESLGIASSGDLSTLSNRVTQNESDIETISDNVGDLSELTTTDKTNIVNAINEAVAGGGGSSGGVKCKRFTSKSTNTNITINGISYVGISESTVKSWFNTEPNTIHAIIAIKSNGAVTRVAIKNTGSIFVMEQSNSNVTYTAVEVFYE